MKKVLLVMRDGLSSEEQAMFESSFQDETFEYIPYTPQSADEWLSLCQNAGDPDSVLVLLPNTPPAVPAVNAGYIHIVLTPKGPMRLKSITPILEAI